MPATVTDWPGSSLAARDVGAVSETLRSLLDEQPAAWVGAIGPDARYVAMPPGVPLAGHRVLEGRWALDDVASSDRPACSQAWRQRTTTGVVALSVRLVTGEPATFYLFSLTEQYGADILVVVSEPRTDISAAVCGPPAPVPRFCRVGRDQAGRIIEIDELAPLVLGWPAAALLQGDPPLSRVHVDDHGRVIDNWLSTLAGGADGHRCRARLGRPDGSWVWLEITNFNHLDDTDKPCVVSEMLDISEEMAAHQAVREREQLLNRLAEALPLGVIQLADDRRIIYKNDRLTAILGNPAASTADEQFAATVAEDRPTLHVAIDDALQSGSDHHLTVRVRQGGPESERLVQVITKALHHDNGAVCGVIACVSDVTETTLMSRELERRATFDSLTGCYNRESILALLGAALASGQGEAGTASIFIDLDDFKAVNDDCGHAVGDELLKTAAEDMRRATRGDDLVGRLGGDEFLIVCQDTAAPAAMQVAQRVAAILSRERSEPGGQLQLRASVGVAWAANDTVDIDELVARADAAMYLSKRAALGVPHLWTAADRLGDR
jgi:diguanylate cyclase (GGDEF)-like protein/PAS domain S-box-containing protein